MSGCFLALDFALTTDARTPAAIAQEAAKANEACGQGSWRAMAGSIAKQLIQRSLLSCPE